MQQAILPYLVAVLDSPLGRGIASEAARSLVEHGFRVGYPEIWAACAPENTRSLRVLEKIGLTRTDEALDLGKARLPPGMLMFRVDAATWSKRG